MATQRSTDKAAEAAKDSGTAKAAEQQPPNYVAPADGPEHGYIGQVHPEKNNDDYTVAGVTGGTAKASDTPPSSAADDTRKAWKPLSS
jgi:hypothetical protein